LSRYKRLEDKYRLKALSRYRPEKLKPYRPSKMYPNPYRKIFRVKKVSKSSYAKPQGRRRGRLPHPKPNYFQIKAPEKKYELKPKPEKMSSPPLTKTPRYTLEKQGVEPLVDAEQIAKDVEERLDSKLTGILERFEAEFEELMQKVVKPSETSAAISIEKNPEPSKQEVEIEGVEAWMNHGEGREGEGENPRIESVEDSSEVQGESKEDVSLEGGFLVSETFGLAIPTETEELEDIIRESVEEIGDEVYESEPPEIEALEKESGKEPESVEEERIDDIEEAHGEIEPLEGEVIGTESLEDIEAEEPINLEKEIEVASEDITETENTLEPLPEETELYPVEQEPEIM
jgi:hypothetical protein